MRRGRAGRDTEGASRLRDGGGAVVRSSDRVGVRGSGCHGQGGGQGLLPAGTRAGEPATGHPVNPPRGWLTERLGGRPDER